MTINRFKYLNDTTSGRSGANSFRLYDPELAKKITNEARKTMMSLNDIIAGGGYKLGEMVVLSGCGKGGKSRLNELQEIDNDTKEPRSTEVSEPVPKSGTASV